MYWKAKVELFEQLRQEHEFGVATIAGVAAKFGVHRAGWRVGTALTEGTANFLVNRRMNKAQQMRWSRRGADSLLQVRCAVYNGTLGSGFGQKFRNANAPYLPIAIAA